VSTAPIAEGIPQELTLSHSPQAEEVSYLVSQPTAPHDRDNTPSPAYRQATQWTVADFAAFTTHKNYWVVTRPTAWWVEAIDRLVEGYQDSAGRGYAAVTRTSEGCCLAQKKGNRTTNAYCQVTCAVPRGYKRANRNLGPHWEGDEKPFGAHQIVAVLTQR